MKACDGEHLAIHAHRLSLMEAADCRLISLGTAYARRSNGKCLHSLSRIGGEQLFYPRADDASA